jgi:hypothetical protein
MQRSRRASERRPAFEHPGGALARAKRTDRSTARRRYRAQLAARATADQGEPSEESLEQAVAGGRGARTARPAAPGSAPTRPGGFGYALRESFRPLDLRGDLAYLPSLIRHKSVLAPVGLSVASTVLLFVSAPNLTSTGGGSSAGPVGFLAVFLFQYFVVSPPVGAAFLAGFLAPRASWVAGGIAGLVAVACLATLVYSPTFSDLLGSGEASAYIAAAVLYSVVGSAAFASAAAWYRRFLSLVNPNRGRPPARQGRGAGQARAAARRR